MRHRHWMAWILSASSSACGGDNAPEERSEDAGGALSDASQPMDASAMLDATLADGAATSSPDAGQMIGAPCTAHSQCPAPYPFCAIDGTERYCTMQECTQSNPCPEGYECDQGVGMSYCRKWGVGRPCSRSSDCVGAADYCEAFSTKVCLISECASDTSKCPDDYGCCDLTAFIQTSVCVPLSSLQGGVCADGRAPLP